MTENTDQSATGLTFRSAKWGQHGGSSVLVHPHMSVIKPFHLQHFPWKDNSPFHTALFVCLLAIKMHRSFQKAAVVATSQEAAHMGGNRHRGNCEYRGRNF